MIQFGEISQLWQNENIVVMFWGFILYLATFFTVAIASVLYEWAKFHCCKWPNMGKLSGHTLNQDGQFYSEFFVLLLIWIKFVLDTSFGTNLSVGSFNQTIWTMRCLVFRETAVHGKENAKWAVVVAHLVKRSLPTPEVRGSNPVVGKFIYRTFAYRLSIVLKRRK